MKGQMFVITMVFLMGMLAVIQQSLLMYGTFDLSAPARSGRYILMENIKDVLDETVATSDACGTKNDLENNFYEVVEFVRESSVKEGYVVNLDHSRVYCSAIGTDNPVLVISPIRIVSGGFSVEENYHALK
ncbi:MAG: hypothetical protein GXO64_01325 [Candidatus Micrarchaeota archaeon]|nr:hypothetical protein [Candidatus Micrarchaeota archaeon]